VSFDLVALTRIRGRFDAVMTRTVLLSVRLKGSIRLPKSLFEKQAIPYDLLPSVVWYPEAPSLGSWPKNYRPSLMCRLPHRFEVMMAGCLLGFPCYPEKMYTGASLDCRGRRM